jgi:outer membrane protein assembly factor BamB
MLTVGSGRVYAAGCDHKLHAIDARSGAVLWAAPIGKPNDFGSTPVVSAGVVYVETNALHALDAATGAERWVAQTGGTSLFAFVPPVVSAGAVYVSGGDSLLHEFDAATGAARGTQGRVPPAPNGDPMFGRAVVAIPPAVAGDYLFLSSGDKRVYAYAP